jgi:rhamnogalacturonyl hydrolase YesR
MYRWVRTCLAAPDGLYWDHIDGAGHIDETEWSYNQGAMVAAAVELYRATGQPRYLQDAQQLADAAVAHYRPFETSSEPPYLLAIFFHDLWLLAEVDPGNHYDADVRAYADGVWKSHRDSATGLFHFGGAQQVQLIEQASMVRIYADLAIHS